MHKQLYNHSILYKKRKRFILGITNKTFFLIDESIQGKVAFKTQCLYFNN